MCCALATASNLCLHIGGLLTLAFSVSPDGSPMGVRPAQAGASSQQRTRHAGAREGSLLAGGQQPARAEASRGSPLRALPEIFTSFQSVMDAVPQQVEELGPLGPVYFFCVYVLAECLALPATPLTLSAGYLFGLPLGCAVALAGGTVAAGIGFLLSRTLLRPQIEELAAGNENFQNINRAVEREGFKIILLLRLSPLLPFALSNYVYGLSNAGFLDFILATALGFAPGTCAYVYLATTARSVLGGTGEGQPWYVYAVGIAVTIGLLKVVSDIAKQAVDDAIESDKAAGASPALANGERWSFEGEKRVDAEAGSTAWMDSLKENYNA